MLSQVNNITINSGYQQRADDQFRFISISKLKPSNLTIKTKTLDSKECLFKL